MSSLAIDAIGAFFAVANAFDKVMLVLAGVTDGAVDVGTGGAAKVEEATTGLEAVGVGWAALFLSLTSQFLYDYPGATLP